ncbi:MAG TPA: hypothetical protein PKZ76_00450, partial [Xanthomonadaceae bacterium]|nr:hypothetical protein [Xanthomonadaceae bacterium]
MISVRQMVIVALIASGNCAQARDGAFEAQLRFEVSEAREGEPPPGWEAAPPESVALVRDMAHGGDASVRIERDADAAGERSMLFRTVDVDFVGSWIELRGVFRMDSITNHAGLLLRQNGEAGMLRFDTMQVGEFHGTADWQTISLRQRLHPDTRTLQFGVHLSGTGRLWVDEVEILVDGRRFSESPRRIELPGFASPTILDTDLAFAEGSGVTSDALTSQLVEHVAALGEVWGFLKYHHPRVTRGELHWDFELFRVLPRVLGAIDADARNAVLVAWIDGIGMPEPCRPCAQPTEHVHLEAPLAWLGDTERLGDALSDRLRRIHENRRADPRQFYVAIAPGPGNPDFARELSYDAMREPDAGYRILAVLRLWNIVRYWFPYRDLIDDDWNAVLREFLPRIVEAADRSAYDLVMMAMMARIQDGHATLLPLTPRPPRGTCNWPVALRFLEGRPVVVGIESMEGEAPSPLRIGDIIEAIDGQPVDRLEAAWSPYYSASHHVARRFSLARFMTKGACGDSIASIVRNGASVAVAVERHRRRAWRPHHFDRPGPAFQR